MSGRQLSFLPETPDEDGNQLDLLEQVAHEGVLSQPCPACGAPPGRPCVSIRDGYSALHDFHRARPDGYDQAPR
jgi:hypothetical protein